MLSNLFWQSIFYYYFFFFFALADLFHSKFVSSILRIAQCCVYERVKCRGFGCMPHERKRTTKYIDNSKRNDKQNINFLPFLLSVAFTATLSLSFNAHQYPSIFINTLFIHTYITNFAVDPKSNWKIIMLEFLPYSWEMFIMFISFDSRFMYYIIYFDRIPQTITA